MSSGFSIDPSTPANLDYGHGNDDNQGDNTDSHSSSNQPKSYIDRSDARKERDKSLEMRKARKKEKRKKKKISERDAREFNQDQAED